MKNMAPVGAVLLMFAVSCGPQPDERAFVQLAVGYVLDGATLSGENVVVFDSENLEALPTDIRAELARRLDAADVEWIELDIGGDIEQLPGQWEETNSIGRLSRVNRTHSLLRIQVNDRGRTRVLQWSRRCGPLCGGGGEVAFRWNGQEWSHKKESTVSY